MIMLACPIIHGFVYHIENVGQTISDPGQKLIVYTLPSIWQYPFFQNGIKILVFCQTRHPQKVGFCLYCIAYWYCLLAPVIPVWNNSACYSGVELPQLNVAIPPKGNQFNIRGGSNKQTTISNPLHDAPC